MGTTEPGAPWRPAVMETRLSRQPGRHSALMTGLLASTDMDSLRDDGRDSGARSSRGKALRWILPAAIAAWVAFVAAAPDGFSSPDAALYAEQAAARDFGQRTIHLGYHFLAAGVATLVPGAGDRGQNAMSGLFGAIALGAIGWLGFSLTGSRRFSALSMIVLASQGLFLRHALMAEVYIVATAILLLAIVGWRNRMPFVAGIALGAAGLVAPQSWLAVVCFLWLPPGAPPASGRSRVRDLLLLLAGAALIVLPALLPHLDDYLHGRRGILAEVRTPFRPWFAFRKEAAEVVRGFTLLLPFTVVGLVAWWRDPRMRAWVAAFAALGVATFVLSERHGDVPVQLPLYALLSLPAAHGIVLAAGSGGARARIRRRAAVGALVAMAAAASLWTAAAERRSVIAFRETAHAIDRDALPGYRLHATWGKGVLFEHYTLGRAYAGRWIWCAPDGTFHPAGSGGAQPSGEELAADRFQDLWFLDVPAPADRLRREGYTITTLHGCVRATRAGD